MTTTLNADDGVVSGSAGLKYSADSSGVLALQTNGTTAVSISASQVVTLTNALPVASGGSGVTTSTGTGANVLGTTPSFTSTIGVGGATASASGAGITFPATQSASLNANTLDDYEEGTFTLVVAPTAGSLTSYTSEGQYVKIGQAITIFGVFTLGTIGTASGGADLSGLPYASMSSALSSRTATGVARENAATGGIYQVYVNSGLTTGAVLTLTNNAITWTSGYSYLFTISYITAS